MTPGTEQGPKQESSIPLKWFEWIRASAEQHYPHRKIVKFYANTNIVDGLGSGVDVIFSIPLKVLSDMPGGMAIGYCEDGDEIIMGSGGMIDSMYFSINRDVKEEDR